jgi:hypothetical protein
MVAQALLERGLLDSFVAGLDWLFIRATSTVITYPWIWIVVAAALVLLLRDGGRSGSR